MKQKYLTVVQAARQKGVSRTSIYSAIKAKELRATEMLGRTVVTAADLSAWNVRSVGWTKGKPVSQAAKARISKSQKQRWAKRKQKSD